MSDYLNPVILGSALGATLILAVVGFSLSRLIRRFIEHPSSNLFGFLLAGAIAICLAAFGFANSGPPRWIQAVYAYGIPSIIAAIASGVTAWLLSPNKSSHAVGNSVVFVALFVGSFIGARLALIEESFSNEALIFSDPLMVGFAAVEDEYPALWSELKADLKGAQVKGDSPFPVAAEFFIQHQANFIMLASDEAVVEMSAMVAKKLRYLAKSDPEVCLELAMGRSNPKLAQILPYELKLDEAKAIERLVRSNRKGNSGVATSEEAEALIIAAWKRLAESHPQRFFASIKAISNDDVEDALACEGFLKVQEFLLENSEASFARMSRSDINLEPSASMSQEGELSMTLLNLYADAALINENAPQTIDSTTTLIGANYINGAFTYNYQINVPVKGGSELSMFFESEVLPQICSGSDLDWAFDLGVEFRFTYMGSDEQTVTMNVDSSRCTM